MEVLTDSPSGTHLRIDSDRQFDTPTGDSVLRVQGERDGGQVFDAAYVEVGAQEANVIAKALRILQKPHPELQDEITQEIQATYSSRLSGRDAHQIAEVCGLAQRTWIARLVGGDPQSQEKTMERLAERFERAAAKRSGIPGNYTPPGNGGEKKKD